MSYARQMLDTYPRTFNANAALLAAAIDALSNYVRPATPTTPRTWASRT